MEMQRLPLAVDAFMQPKSTAFKIFPTFCVRTFELYKGINDKQAR